MTTIAYNHKDREIAVDSRCTRNNIIDTDRAIKHRVVDGVTFVLCGSPCDYDLLIDYYFGRQGSNLIPDAKCIAIDEGSAFEFVVGDNSIIKDRLDVNTAFGSGGDFALAAMDFGCNAKDAVKYSMTRDCKTGGRVKVFKVK